LTSAFYLSVSDQRRVLQEYLGLRLPPDLSRLDTRRLLIDLVSEAYPHLMTHEFMRDWVRERVTLQEWWAIQFLDTYRAGHLNWKLLATRLQFALGRTARTYQPEHEADYFQIIRGVISMFVIGNTNPNPGIDRKLQELWPEMLEYVRSQQN